MEEKHPTSLSSFLAQFAAASALGQGTLAARNVARKRFLHTFVPTREQAERAMRRAAFKRTLRGILRLREARSRAAGAGL